MSTSRFKFDPAQPPRDEAQMRAAVQALLDWQLAAGPSAAPRLDAAAELQSFATDCVQGEFGRAWNETQQQWWERGRKALLSAFESEPQLPLREADAVGPAGYELIALLRDPDQPWEEHEELDLAIRWWEAARKAGLALDADFGALWQQLEWIGLQRHLAQAGALCRAKAEGRISPERAAQLLPRLLAYAIKTSTRYVQLAPLTKLVQDLQGSLVQDGFTLR